MKRLPSAGLEIRGARTPLLLLVASGLVFAGYYFGLRYGRPSFWNDTYEYAQAARNLAEGRGLTTDAATVREIGLFGQSGLPLPYFLHDPGNSLIMAAAFRIFGPGEGVVALGTGICFALLAPLTYCLGQRLVRPDAALLAGVLVAVNAQLLVYAGAGYSEVPIALCLTALLLLVLTATSWVGHLLVGIAFGCLVLLRANGLPFLPWVLLFVATRPTAPAVHAGSRWRRVAVPVVAFLLGATCVLGANVARNRFWTGRWSFAMHGSTLVYHTAVLPGKTTDLFSRPPQAVDAVGYVLEHPGELLSKMSWQMSREVGTLLQGGQLPHGDFLSAILVFFFFLAILAPRRGEDTLRRRFRWLVLGLLATALLVGAAFHLRSRHLYAFLPVLIVFAAEELARLAGRRMGRGRALALVVLLAAAFGIGPVLDTVGVAGRKNDVRDNFHRKLGRFLSEHTPDHAVILLKAEDARFNPLGNALAWHGRRTLLEYSAYTLESPLLRGTRRPVYGLLVRPPWEQPPPPAEEGRTSGESGLDPARGFRLVATFTHGLGTAILYR